MMDGNFQGYMQPGKQQQVMHPGVNQPNMMMPGQIFPGHYPQLQPTVPKISGNMPMGVQGYPGQPPRQMQGYPMKSMQPMAPMHQQHMQANQVQTKNTNKRNHKNMQQKYLSGNSTQMGSQQSSAQRTAYSGSPQTSYAFPIQNNLANALKSLPDTHQELFYRLFECRYNKKGEEAFEIFRNNIIQRLLPSIPSIIDNLVHLVESLKQSDELYQRLANPPLPTVFQLAKGARPIYKPLLLYNQGYIDTTPYFKDSKISEFILLGSFVSTSSRYQPDSVMVGDYECKAKRFGEVDNFFQLPSRPAKISISIPMSSNFTWFVLQFVERRHVFDVIKTIMAQKGREPYTEDIPIQCKLPDCKSCSLPLHSVISGIQKTGSLVCNLCNSTALLSDITIINSQSDLSAQNLDDDKETQQYRQVLAEKLCELTKSTNVDSYWNSTIFESNGFDFGDPENNPFT